VSAVQTQYTASARREVAVDLYTTAGWIHGSFLMPPMRGLTPFANQDHDFFKLKDVVLPGLGQPMPFFLLQRREVFFFIPGEGHRDPPPAFVERNPRDVSCAFANGVVSGRLTLNKGIRVSDFMLNKAPFFELEDASVFIRTAGAPEVRRNIPIVVISRWRLLGVSEPRFV
jgi:hypothetical protein